MELKKAFDQAVNKSRTLENKPSNDILLKMYGLFKQATEGDVKGERPGGFDFKGIAKYEAWANVEGKSNEAAMQEYIELVQSLFDQ